MELKKPDPTLTYDVIIDTFVVDRLSFRPVTGEELLVLSQLSEENPSMSVLQQGVSLQARTSVLFGRKKMWTSGHPLWGRGNLWQFFFEWAQVKIQSKPAMTYDVIIDAWVVYCIFLSVAGKDMLAHSVLQQDVS